MLTSSIKKEIFDWIKTIGFAVVFAVVINYFGGIAIVNGESMRNTLEHNDILILERVTYRKELPSYGDIIAFKTDMPYPEGIYKTLGYTKNLVKRIIGLPGDHMVVADGNVYRNGERLEEPYIKDGVTNKFFDGVVPEGHVFVMGDNRLNSNDSRSEDVGYVPIDKILGRAFTRIFPFDRLGKP